MAIYSHVVWFLPVACLYGSGCEAAALQDGRLSQVVHDVRLTEADNAPLSAGKNIPVRDGSIRTGPDSRAEISFHDHTVIRLGDKTVLGVETKSRTFDLTAGAVLTQVPGGVGSTTLKVRAITATATGNTLVVECLPQAYTKFIVLDGTSRLCLRSKGLNRDCILLRAGQMLIAGPNATNLPETVDVDLSRLNETCQFITQFPKLPDQDQLTRAAAAQHKRKSNGAFAETNLVIFGRGTLVTQKSTKGSPAAAANTVSASPSPLPKQNPVPP